MERKGERMTSAIEMVQGVKLDERKAQLYADAKKKLQDPQKKAASLKAAGSVVTEHVIDSQEIYREVRG